MCLIQMRYEVSHYFEAHVYVFSRDNTFKDVEKKNNTIPDSGTTTTVSAPKNWHVFFLPKSN